MRGEGYVHCIDWETESQEGLVLWSSLGIVLTPREHLEISEAIPGCHNRWVEGATVISRVEASMQLESSCAQTSPDNKELSKVIDTGQ